MNKNLSIKEVKKILSLTSNQLCDEIEENNSLPVYVRFCEWKKEIRLRNERILGRENLNIIIKAIRNKQSNFCLILTDEQVEGEAKRREYGYKLNEKYETELSLNRTQITADKIPFSEVITNPDAKIFKLNNGKLGTLSDVNAKIQGDYIRDKYPLRLKPRGKVFEVVMENTVYSDPISCNNIFFKQKDIEIFLKKESPEQKELSKGERKKFLQLIHVLLLEVSKHRKNVRARPDDDVSSGNINNSGIERLLGEKPYKTKISKASKIITEALNTKLS